MPTSAAQFMSAPVHTHRRAAFEVAVVTGFAVAPLLLGASWLSNFQPIANRPDFWSALLASSGSGQLYFFALSTLGSVAAKIWPSEGLSLSVGGIFNLGIAVCLLACGFLLGVDPTLQRTRTDFVTTSSVILFAVSLLMLYYTIVCDRIEAPNLEKNSQSRTKRLKQKMRERMEAKPHGE